MTSAGRPTHQSVKQPPVKHTLYVLCASRQRLHNHMPPLHVFPVSRQGGCPAGINLCASPHFAPAAAAAQAPCHTRCADAVDIAAHALKRQSRQTQPLTANPTLYTVTAPMASCILGITIPPTQIPQREGWNDLKSGVCPGTQHGCAKVMPPTRPCNSWPYTQHSHTTPKKAA